MLVKINSRLYRILYFLHVPMMTVRVGTDCSTYAVIKWEGRRQYYRYRMHVLMARLTSK
jgi:hypothetical protein